LQEIFDELAVSGLASLYPAFDWNMSCSWPSWVSARVRSPSAATSADTARGNPRYGITRRGGNNDRLSTLWREVISLTGERLSALTFALAAH